MREQISRRLDQVAARRQIERRAWKRRRRAESEQGFAWLRGFGIKAQRGLRRVVRSQHAGRKRARLHLTERNRERVAEHALDRVAGQAAGPQQCRLADAGHDRRFDADRARAGIEDQIDPAAQIGEHMRGACRRHVTGAVCRGRDHRAAERCQAACAHRMRRHAHRDAVEPGERKIGHAAIRLLRQHQRQRSGPERGRELFGGRRENADPARGVDTRRHARSAD